MDYDKIYKGKDISYYANSRPELMKFIPKGIKDVLDVGCGAGNFGKMLQEISGCRVWGIEPNTKSANEAQTNLYNVINSLFNKATIAHLNQKFDCIFFNDVLEHLADPEDTLLLCKSLLKENGCIIASIPNIRFYPVMLSLFRYKDFKYEDAGVLDKTHLRFFTQKSMVRLFESAGYAVKQIEGINKHYFRFLSLFNIIFLNSLEDMHYPQFAVVAKLK